MKKDIIRILASASIDDEPFEDVAYKILNLVNYNTEALNIPPVIKSVCTACSGSGCYCGVDCGACDGTGEETD